MVQKAVMVSNFGALGREVQKRVANVVHATSAAVLADSINRMSGPKGGRFYAVPGQAGVLKRSVGVKNAGVLERLGIERLTGKSGDGGSFAVGTRIYRASAPGESPARPTGNLAASGSVVVEGPLTDSVEFTAAQALALEMGRTDGSITARPFVRPAVADQTVKFGDAIASAVNSAADSLKTDGGS